MPNDSCSIIEDGKRCPKAVHSREMCAMHYRRWRIHGDPLIVLQSGLPRQDIRCTVVEDGVRCDLPHLAKGCCSTHYARQRKHGDPLTVLPGGAPRRTDEQKEATQRAWRFLRHYGITVAEYDVMLAAQDGRCALCRQAPKRHRARKNGVPWAALCIDHDHGDGRVRGLLCHGCNIAMGRVDKVGVDAITGYLRRTG